MKNHRLLAPTQLLDFVRLSGSLQRSVTNLLNIRVISALTLILLSFNMLAQTISIQGVLRDPNGRSVDDGFYNVTFSIYDVATDGTALWTDTYTDLQTKHGVFQANLGEQTSIAGLAFDVTYYVGVTVENFAEMTPRIELTTFPYAMAIKGGANKFPSAGNVVLEEDSIIVKQGALKFEGPDGRIVFNDGTSLNTADFSGPASALLNPSSININADKDAVGSGAINFQIAGSTKAAILNDGRANFSNTLVASSGLLEVGQNLNTKGVLNLFGPGTAQQLGGELRLFKALDHATTSGYWSATADGTALSFGSVNATSNILRLEENGNASISGALTVTGTSMNLGQNDVEAGFLNIYGDDTGSSQGGRLSLYKAADHDGGNVTEYWFMETINEDLRVGNAFANNDVLRVRSDGNLGIRVADPTLDLTIGDSDTGIDWAGDGKYYLTSNGSVSLTINNDGNVGIGAAATAPTEAKLVVRGSAQDDIEPYFYMNSGGTGSSTSGSGSFGIYTTARIAAPEFNAFSDERIKNIHSRSQNGEDLNTLMQIEVTDYEFIDQVEKGPGKHKKVIAQQIEEVYPLAVSKSSDFIPSVFEMSEEVAYDLNTRELAIRTAKRHDFEVGTLTRLIALDEMIETEVLRVLDENTFVVSTGKPHDKIFVHGKKVDDFRSVDYDAISMLNVSATQELAKRSEDQEQRIAQLEAENAELRKQLQKLNALEAKVNALIGIDEDKEGLLGQN